MVNVSASEKRRERADQTEALYRSPADTFDATVGGIRVGSDHHFAAGELAVTEAKEQARAWIPVSGVDSVWKREVLQIRNTGKDAENVSEFAEALESLVGQGTDVGRKAEAEQVEK